MISVHRQQHMLWQQVVFLRRCKLFPYDLFLGRDLIISMLFNNSSSLLVYSLFLVQGSAALVLDVAQIVAAAAAATIAVFFVAEVSPCGIRVLTISVTIILLLLLLLIQLQGDHRSLSTCNWIWIWICTDGVPWTAKHAAPQVAYNSTTSQPAAS